MSAKTFGEIFKQLREARNLSTADVAAKIGWSAGASTLYRYESGERLPRLETLDQLADAMELDYEDRMYLYGLAGYLPTFPQPTESEITRNLDRHEAMLENSLVPMFIMDYDYRIHKMNSIAIKTASLDEREVKSALENRISLFEAMFSEAYNFRPHIGDDFDTTWRWAMTELILDFMTFNALRRHEAFYAEYPEKFSHLSGFIEIWNEAQSSSAYEQVLKARSRHLSYIPIRVKAPVGGVDLKVYISPHSIPTLGNLFRLVRFIPLDDQTEKFFQTQALKTVEFKVTKHG